MADRLGDVPVALAAGGLEGRLRERRDEGAQRLGDRGELRGDALRAAGPGPAADLAAHGDEPPRLDAAERGHGVRGARFHAVQPVGQCRPRSG